MTDELDTLARAAQAGDPVALEELLARIRPTVLARCAKFLPHHHDAEEAAQDALLTITTKLGSWSGSGSFIGWVTVVSSNSARGTYRSMRRQAQVAGVELPEPPDPRTTSVIAGTRLDLMEALEGLEAQHPAVVQSFVLRDLGALPYDEIAELTGVPVGTAKARIHHARRFMRDRLRLQPDADIAPAADPAE